MNLFKLSVEKPVTVIMLTLAIVIIGGISLLGLPIDLLPEIEVPVAIVSTSYQGVGPTEIEQLVTEPLENSIATVSSIKQVNSVSTEGQSILIAEFTQGTDMEFASLEMREKVDLVKGFLPKDSNDPMVIKIDPNATPIIQLSVTKKDGKEDLLELQNLGEDIIKPRLERISGVASVSISGGYEDQIEVIANEEKLKGYGLSQDNIIQVLRAENLNLPAGEVKKGSQSFTVRTQGEIESVEEFESIPITTPSGGVVYLGDVADVTAVYKEIESISKLDGKRSVNVSIQKQSSTNTVTVAREINKEIEKIRQELKGIEIGVVMDQSIYIQDSIKNVAVNALTGGILAVLILYVFLKNVRSTLIIATSIPVSIIFTFILMYFNDITLNLMTLGGLTLGVGMLVDNSIVVLENIYRFIELGYSRKDAAINGAKEVGMAIIASTLTTVAVFLPIAFVEGITSVIFKEFALTITMSLGASLLISLTLVPMLSSKLLKVEEKRDAQRTGIFGFFNRIYDASDRLFESLENKYKEILGWALEKRKATMIIATAIFVISMCLLPTLGMEFFPTADQGQFGISVELPTGSELEKTNEIVGNIENQLKDIKEIDEVFSTIGSSGNQMSLSRSGTNTANIQVNLKKLGDRKRSDVEVSDQVRKIVKDIPGAEIGVQVSSSMMGGGMSSGNPIDIKIKGDNLDVLKKIGEDIEGIAKKIEGTREVESSMRDGVPEVQISVDRLSASQYGLTAGQIASSVRGNISGQVATRYKVDGNEIDVLVKGDSMYKESISNLKQSIIHTPTGVSVPLEQVASLEVKKGPVAINREGQVRTINVTGQIVKRDLGSVNKDIEKELLKYKMPKGYTYELGGESEQIMEAFSSLALALVLAVILVYMVLASQFESLLYPFMIMLSVPLAMAGGVLGLVVTRRSISIISFIGFIMLAGIVVNNAIVLVDYINIRRKGGEERELAILNAGPIRLRPILMTTLTTVLGLIPLALGIGDGAEIQAPMATVVVSGLTLSTVLTLVFIPVMYIVLDDLTIKIKNKIFKKQELEV